MRPTPSPHRGLRLLTVLLAFALGLGASTAGWSQDDSPRIAVVDLEALFFSAKEGQDLQTQLADLEKQTKARVDEIAGRIDQLRQEAATNTGEERRIIGRQIEDEERTARRVAENAQRQAGKLEQQARESYNTRLEPLLRQIQEEENLDLILNKAPGVVVFASSAIDMSQALLAKLEGEGG